MAESPRPTREQVDAALAHVDEYVAAPPVGSNKKAAGVLAAEVRALRADLEQQQRFTDVWRRAHAETSEGARAALAARTPQLVESRRLLSMERDGVIEVVAQALGDGDVRELDEELAARAVDAALRYLSSQPYPIVLGPQPAVPDGEDVPARLDAAADALAKLSTRPDDAARQAERHLRRAADWINAMRPTARAAVAAALAGGA